MDYCVRFLGVGVCPSGEQRCVGHEGKGAEDAQLCTSATGCTLSISKRLGHFKRAPVICLWSSE